MGKKESRNFSMFTVKGVKYTNAGMNMTRLEWICRYVRFGSKFVLEREPDNVDDKNAIKVKHVLAKSGKRITVGYVPRKLAAEWAPLMDEYGWNPQMTFGRMHLIETEKQAEKRGLAIGTKTGMMVRYPKR